MRIKLAVVILNYNDAITTLRLLTRLKQYSIIDLVVVVDNCSTDNSFEILSKQNDSKVVVIKSEKNGGYGYGNNFGIIYLNRIHHPQYIMIANPDIDVEEAVISKMIRVFESDKSIAIVAPFMLDRNGKKNPGTAWRVPTKYEYIISAELLCGHFLKPSCYTRLDKYTDKDVLQVGCVAGSLLMVDATLMQQYGMYDEKIFLFGEETTLGCKFKNAGCKTILLLNETFLHMHGVSINKTISSDLKKRKMMLASREYILKRYMNATKLDIVLAKIVYAISMIEYRLFLIKNIF